MKKIRVIHLIHKLDIGGAETVVLNISKQLNPSQFESAICSFVGNGVLTKRLDRSQVKLFELNKLPGNDPSIPYKLYKIFKEWRPDIIHSHCWGTLCEGYIGAKLARVPIVIHHEHGTIQDKKSNIYVQRFIWSLHDEILAVSNNHKKRLANVINFSESKIKVIYNGVDTHQFSMRTNKTSIRTALGISKDNIVIGAVGRLHPVKDHASLLRAFALVNEGCQDLKLLIVGDGPLHNQLMTLSSTLEIEEKVQFLGARDDISDLLSIFDIFVLPSISEGTSCTLLEAMSSGLPVVATCVGGNPEIVKTNITGILIPPQNSSVLAEALSRLIESPDLRKSMGKRGRELVEKCYSLKEIVKSYESLYSHQCNPRI